MALTQVPIELSSTPGIVDNSNTTAITIDSSQQVGIGASSVDQKLHLEESGSASVFLKTQNSAGALLVGNNSAGNSFVSAQTSGKPLIFETENTERMRILPTGGITFNGDTAQANALDDYEEGNFTPTVHTGWTSVSYTTQGGTYTKVGRLVHFQITLVVTVVNRTANSSRFDIGGLPFTKTGQGASVSLWSDLWNMGGSNNMANGLISATRIEFYQSNYASGAESSLTGLEMNSANGNELYISGTYEAT